MTVYNKIILSSVTIFFVPSKLKLNGSSLLFFQFNYLCYSLQSLFLILMVLFLVVFPSIL